MAERFDLEAIAADDAFLDRLAAGGEALYDALDAGGDDPAVRMLGELRVAVEVVEDDERAGSPDDELERILARGAGKGSGADPLARKIATRTLALGVAAVAGLSVSGVAAAVTGDPLSPYEKVIEKVVDGLRPQSTFPIKSVGGVVSSKSESKNAVKEYKKAVDNKGDQPTRPEQTDGESEKVVAVDPLHRVELNRTDLPPLVTKEPVLTDREPEPIEPLQRQDDSGDTDEPITDPVQPDKSDVDPTPPPTDPTSEPTTDPTSEPTTDPTGEPATDPTTDPTQPPPTTDPSPTPTADTNQPSGDSTAGTSDGTTDGTTGTSDGTAGVTDGRTEGGSAGGADTETAEEEPADQQSGEASDAGSDEPSDPPTSTTPVLPTLPTTPVTPTARPTVPSVALSDDTSGGGEAASASRPDHTDRPSAKHRRPSAPDSPSLASAAANSIDRPAKHRRPVTPDQLDPQTVRKIISTLNDVMAPAHG